MWIYCGQISGVILIFFITQNLWATALGDKILLEEDRNQNFSTLVKFVQNCIIIVKADFKKEEKERILCNKKVTKWFNGSWEITADVDGFLKLLCPKLKYQQWFLLLQQEFLFKFKI